MPFPSFLAVLLAAAVVLTGCGIPSRIFETSGEEGKAVVGKSGGIYKVGNPYTVGGRWYTPKVQPDYRAEGIASWYGPQFHGKRTANGEIFDQYALTAAHKTLPLPSKVRVTNLENGRQLVVRVNDRGPFVGDRVIDLSRRSAQLLGIEKTGVAPVRLELLDSGPHLLDEPLSKEPGQVNVVAPVKMGRVYVQVGAFSHRDNARKLVKEVDRFGDPHIQVNVEQGLHRVRFGPFGSALQADELVLELERAGYLSHVVVQSR